jgi:hypothetical protein
MSLASLLVVVLIWAVWILWAFACVASVRADEIRRGRSEHRNVSFFPGIPMFPVMFWAIMALINKVAPPWGTFLIGGFHIALAIPMLVTTIRDTRFCRLNEPAK